MRNYSDRKIFKLLRNGLTVRRIKNEPDTDWVSRIIPRSNKTSLSLTLDLILKLFSIVAVTGIIWGGTLFWIYLKHYNIQRKFIEVISTPNILIFLSLFGILFSYVIVWYFAFAPYIYREAKGGAFKTVDEKNKNIIIRKDFYVFFISIISPIAIIELQLSTIPTIGIVIIIIVGMLFLSQWKEKPVIIPSVTRGLKQAIPYYLKITFSIVLFTLPLMFLLMFSRKIIELNNLKNHQHLHFPILLAGSALYAFLASAISNTKKSTWLKLLVSLMLIFGCSFFFPLQSSNVIVSLSGIGNYKTSIAVNEDLDLFISKTASFTHNKAGQVNYPVIYKDIFIVISLPNFQAIKPNKESKDLLLIKNSQNEIVTQK